MINSKKEQHSLSDFKRDATALIKRMKKTGQPFVLTVNGKAEVIVQDAKSYGRLLEVMDRLETIAGIKAGLADVKGGRTQPAREAFEEIRKKHRIPRTT